MRIMYDPRQSVKDNESFSPSAGKPELVMEAWGKLGIPLEITGFTPVTRQQLCTVHDHEYVDGVLDLERANGFSNKLPQVAQALPWVCGSMVAATQAAYHLKSFVFSPTSGAHHAGFSHGGGFCTFNFLALAALELIKAQAGVVRVLILDCDMHYGDGTTDIIRTLELQGKVANIHCFGASAPHNEDDWLEWFRGTVERTFPLYDHIIYNAGADCHIDDPLGGVLTTDGLELRDWMVFNYARMLGLPVSVSLAGGYQEDIRNVIEVHCNTLKQAERVMVYDNGWGLKE